MMILHGKNLQLLVLALVVFTAVNFTGKLARFLVVPNYMIQEEETAAAAVASAVAINDNEEEEGGFIPLDLRQKSNVVPDVIQHDGQNNMNSLQHQIMTQSNIVPTTIQEKEEAVVAKESLNAIPLNQRKQRKHIKFATFGTSFAWGSQLRNREVEAFTWLLSPDATNYALRATGSEYPAKCLSSMIGDNVFDVIILEFAMRVNKSTLALARRLRQRFPDALIINLKVWTPYTVKSRKKQQSLVEIASEAGFSTRTFMHEESFHNYMKDSGINDIYLGFRNQTLEYTDRLEKELGVYVTSVNEINEADPLGWLYHESGKFAQDSFHLSKEGHLDAYKRIERIVERVGVPEKARINDFESFDHCVNWFLTGDMPKDVKYSDTGYLHPLPFNKQKHALAFKGGRGSITLTNPLNNWQYLTISYLTTGPPPSNYPEVGVYINRLNTTTTLPADPGGNWGSQKVHMPREHCIGKVPPGEVTLFFSTLTKSREPFRLVSYIFSPTNPHDYSLS